MHRIEAIDFLRGYSIFTIVVMHMVWSSATGLMKTVLSFGGAGVHVFILVSGFGLYLSYLNNPLSYSDFLRKRFTKVYIPYFFIVVLFAAYYFFCLESYDVITFLSHVFLFKMFSHTWDTSYVYSLWFLSTIFQFYLFWPFIVKLAGRRKGLFLSIIISICWATLVGLLEKQDNRAWSSFFLQYLWEFVLGMKLAEIYKKAPEKFAVPSYGILLVGTIVGMGLSGFMGKTGGVLKLYNDFPSLLGYLSIALIVYKMALPVVNNYFLFTSRISYEWYLVHGFTILVFSPFLLSSMPLLPALFSCFLLSYLFAYVYSLLLMKFGIKNNQR